MISLVNSEVGRILRLGGQKKFSGAGCEFFAQITTRYLVLKKEQMMGQIIIPEFQIFGEFLPLKQLSGTTAGISGAGHNYWGGHGPPGPPSIYLTAYLITLFN